MASSGLSAADYLVQGLRIYIAVIAGLTALVGIPLWRRLPSFLLENQMAWLALAGFNFAAFYGSMDQIIHHTPGGTRTYVTAIAATWALVAVSYRPACQLTRWWRTRRHIAQYQPKRLHTREKP